MASCLDRVLQSIRAIEGSALLAIEGLMSLALSLGYMVVMSFSWEGVPSVGYGILLCWAAVTMFKPLEPR